MNHKLILSLFPGADVLGRGFDRAGFCVVRGPDTLFSQDIRSFFPPPNVFAGIIGGPPCQDFSRARRRPPTGYGLTMLAEFRRLVTQTQPLWFLMENVPGVPDFQVEGYTTQRFNIAASDFGLEQKRNRSFQFGSRDGKELRVPRGTQSQRTKPAALASDGDHGRRRTFAEVCRLQGLPSSFALPGLTRAARFRLVGNACAEPVAYAIAIAISGRDTAPPAKLCPCHCGREVTGKQKAATAACRKRLERSRRSVRAQSHALTN